MKIPLAIFFLVIHAGLAGGWTHALLRLGGSAQMILGGITASAGPAVIASATGTEEWEWKPYLSFCVGMIVFAVAMAAWKSLLGKDRTKADVRIESDFVTRHELDERLKGFSAEIERKFENALHAEFKLLNQERSRSIAGLHGKIEEKSDDLHERINVIDGLVRSFQGELKEFFRRQPRE